MQTITFRMDKQCGPTVTLLGQNMMEDSMRKIMYIYICVCVCVTGLFCCTAEIDTTL